MYNYEMQDWLLPGSEMNNI